MRQVNMVRHRSLIFFTFTFVLYELNSDIPLPSLTSFDLMFTLQVQQQYVNAEGQLVSVHQVDQHLVYSGVSQQQLLAQSVEVSGTHTQVPQIPGQQVYLQQVR